MGLTCLVSSSVVQGWHRLLERLQQPSIPPGQPVAKRSLTTESCATSHGYPHRGGNGICGEATRTLTPPVVDSANARHLRNVRPSKAFGSASVGHSILVLGSCKMAEVPFDAELAERIRAHLDALEIRQVAMFGGRSFMVHEQLAVAAASDGSLLPRCAPDEVERLLHRDGAQSAEMRGKPMSPGWIRVDLDAVRDDAVLAEWIDEAVEYAELQAS